MMSPNFGADDSAAALSWQDLLVGAPTIIAYATLCGRALSQSVTLSDPLTKHANTLLAVAAKRGAFDIRGNKEAFESSDRYLAVCVETGEFGRLLFLQKGNPRETMKFMHGFQQLCQSGLVMHHLQRDFSLTTKGFEEADKLDTADFESLIDFATEVEH